MQKKMSVANDTINSAVLAAVTDRDYVLSHLRLAVQRKSADVTDVITKQILNLELFMRLRVDSLCDENSTASTRVTPTILSLADISEDEAWEAATRNTERELVIGSMSELLFGDDSLESMFFIATTKDKLDGAAVIAFPEMFRAFCKAHETSGVCILPSSTEELLLIPETPDMFSYADMAELVASVNASGVTDPRIALEAVAYRYDTATNALSIAAMAM